MPTLRRSGSNRILTRALQAESGPLVALLKPGAGDCEACGDARRLQARLDAEPDAIIVYNQQADAIALVDGLGVAPTQVFIEIRQDTRGVLGLQAYRKPGRAAEPLELIHD